MARPDESTEAEAEAKTAAGIDPLGATSPSDRGLDDSSRRREEESGNSSGSRAAMGAALAVVDPDRYQLGQEIARGGMGRIFAAYDRQLGRDVVIKQILGAAGVLRSR